MDAFKEYPKIKTGKAIARNFYKNYNYLIMDRFDFTNNFESAR